MLLDDAAPTCSVFATTRERLAHGDDWPSGYREVVTSADITLVAESGLYFSSPLSHYCANEYPSMNVTPKKSILGDVAVIWPSLGVAIHRQSSWYVFTTSGVDVARIRLAGIESVMYFLMSADRANLGV